jgi:hypothetical protein
MEATRIMQLSVPLSRGLPLSLCLLCLLLSSSAVAEPSVFEVSFRLVSSVPVPAPLVVPALLPFLPFLVVSCVVRVECGTADSWVDGIPSVTESNRRLYCGRPPCDRSPHCASRMGSRACIRHSRARVSWRCDNALVSSTHCTAQHDWASTVAIRCIVVDHRRASHRLCDTTGADRSHC